MKVVFGPPPHYEKVAALFPVKGREVYFAWGDTIYVTNSKKMPGPALMAHEAVHGEQQRELMDAIANAGGSNTLLGVYMWWNQYLVDPRFRLKQEIPAHAAELAYKLTHASSRRDRRVAVSVVAGKLASPLYGGLISKDRAKDELLKLVEAI